MPEPLPAIDIDLYDQPGHLIRRAHQIAVSAFHDRFGRKVTPVQYAVLRMLRERPGIDQVTLAREVALDTSTTAELAVRLESRGLIVRAMLARGQRSLSLTDEGLALVESLAPGIQAVQQLLLGRLEAAEHAEFLRLLRKFVMTADEPRSATQEAAAPIAAPKTQRG